MADCQCFPTQSKSERVSHAPIFDISLSQVTPSLLEYRHNDVTQRLGADVRTLRRVALPISEFPSCWISERAIHTFLILTRVGDETEPSAIVPMRWRACGQRSPSQGLTKRRHGAVDRDL